MATSSSDESSTAPKDFHLSSSIDSGSRLSSNHHKCQLCNKPEKTFHCRECIQKGDFCHSSSRLSERFVDKQQRLADLNYQKKLTEQACLEYIGKKLKVDELKTKIRQSHERIQLLQASIGKKRQRQVINKKRLEEINERNGIRAKQLALYPSRVEKVGSMVVEKAEKVAQCSLKLQEQQQALKQIIRKRIQQLTQYIFPISQLQPSRSFHEETSEQDTVSALAEATHTAYVRGRWVFTDSSGELQYCIVSPTLPGSGDYSEYNIWVAENKDGVPSSSSNVAVDHNPAYNITAALTYTAQLVTILAFFLDIRLPYKMVFSDFCSSDMNEQKFARRVARLNANILHLCFSQNVDPNVLHPPRTLHNILQMLNPELGDLGRQGPMQMDPALADSLENQLAQDLEMSEDSGSEEGDSLPCEWEAVPHVQCPEVTAGPVNILSQQMTSTQQATSVAGGLMTSAAASLASLWKGWTGR